MVLRVCNGWLAGWFNQRLRSSAPCELTIYNLFCFLQLTLDEITKPLRDRDRILHGCVVLYYIPCRLPAGEEEGEEAFVRAQAAAGN